MSQNAYRTEGIILKAFNFQDFDKILTVFSPEMGLIKLVVKKANSKKMTGHMTMPLTRAEFVFTKGNSELLKCQEISLVNAHLPLRDDLDSLEAACEILQVILDSQAANTPSPDLYALSAYYLNKIGTASNPHLLTSSFRLKVLRHDGLLGLGDVCAGCMAPLKTSFVSAGQCYCVAHAPHHAIKLDEEELTIATILAYCQTLSQIQDIELTPELREKIKKLFLELISA